MNTGQLELFYYPDKCQAEGLRKSEGKGEGICLDGVCRVQK